MSTEVIVALIAFFGTLSTAVATVAAAALRNLQRDLNGGERSIKRQLDDLCRLVITHVRSDELNLAMIREHLKRIDNALGELRSQGS
ncbi:MAG: hypothetical protein KatS3mg014_2450 [Actinomycetota bacterium]|nr:MAG: hypothetical protein KatS3mg014_2450 [Actinomycetota bacterium]